MRRKIRDLKIRRKIRDLKILFQRTYTKAIGMANKESWRNFCASIESVPRYPNCTGSLAIESYVRSSYPVRHI